LEKSGWMSKDGKARWFLLREQMLYWFTREQPLGADVSRDVRNFIDLSNGCTVRPNYASKRGGFELAIETTLPAKQFVFACQSQAELDGWLAALVEGRARGSEARINGHVRFDRQRRYAVLDASQLRFFADESCRELRAAVDLGSCQPLAPPTNGETTLVLKGALGRTYEIGFQDAAQTLEWRAALDNVQRKASEATQLKRVVTQRKLEHKMANALNGGGGGGKALVGQQRRRRRRQRRAAVVGGVVEPDRARGAVGGGRAAADEGGQGQRRRQGHAVLPQRTHRRRGGLRPARRPPRWLVPRARVVACRLLCCLVDSVGRGDCAHAARAVAQRCQLDHRGRRQALHIHHGHSRNVLNVVSIPCECKSTMKT
jgi:hypothetical protein